MSSFHGRTFRVRRDILAGSIALPALAAVVFAALFLFAVKHGREAEQRLANERISRQAAVRDLEADAAGLRTKLDDLVQGRLPSPLRPLVFDEVIALGEGSNRSILFTRVGTEKRPVYEYHLMFRNDRSESVYPRFRILLFSNVGIQVGQADVQESADWTRMGGEGLAPGERGSFSGRIHLQFDETPMYFFLVALPLDDSLPVLKR